MQICNELNKGTICPIKFTDNKALLVGQESMLDITNKLSVTELNNLSKLGWALGVVRDNKTIDVSFVVNYHTHSEYSLLDGMSRLKDIAKKSSGVTAITDHGNMYGFLKWQVAMAKEGKKALFGCELYVRTIDGEQKGSHLVALAKDEIGRKNLQTLCSLGYEDQYRGKPYVSLDLLREYKEGLIITSACLAGEISSYIINDYDKAKKVARIYKEIFGDDYYLEIQRHELPVEDTVNPLILKLGKELGIKVLAANDSHYLNKDDNKEHEVLLCISTKAKLDEKHFSFDGTNYHYMSDDEFIKLYEDIPEVLVNTQELAYKCNLTINTGVYHLPDFSYPESFSSAEDYLCYLVDEGFKKRFEGTDKLTNKTYIDRLEYEKSVIIQMGFCTYFLIVQDYINWAKSQGIAVGPGRGSAAGSLLAYCLRITELDPLEYDLFFERFLNPSRISMPDIDVDFEYKRRHEVIDYVKNKYGIDNVCNIITFGTLATKMAIKDVARVYNEVPLGDRLSKLVSNDAKSISEAIELSSEFSQLINSSKEAKSIIDTAIKVEGNIRQSSQHACGIVISDKPIRTYMPTCLVDEMENNKKTGNKSLVTQVEAYEVEELGLLKMDMLGLRTMSVIKNTISKVNVVLEKNNLKIVDYNLLDRFDPYLYVDISKGNTYAVFQIESAGMRSFMKELYADFPSKVKVIEDKYGVSGMTADLNPNYLKEMHELGREGFNRLIAGVSLYRPGPMDYIPDYIKGIREPESIIYDTPLLKPILEPTYGVIVYQEQVMSIVQALANFSMADADSIRKAMGKKKQDILDKYKPYFIYGSGNDIDEHTGKPYGITGCVANGISVEVAERIWEKMKDFAKYAFNKSHAASYAVLTITCEWLKYYCPHYYMCEIMNAYIENKDKLKGYIQVARDMNIKILPPDINESMEDFMVVGDFKIRFGLKGLKGLNSLANDIVSNRARLSNDVFLTLSSLAINTNVNSIAMESLIYSGALDTFGYNRNTLITNYKDTLNIAKKIKKDRESGQMELFDLAEVCFEDYVECEELSKSTLLEQEYEITSVYLSGHPLDAYEGKVDKSSIYDIGFIYDEETNTCTLGKASLFGRIINFKRLTTKKDGKLMATFTIEDKTGTISCVCFADNYAKLSNLLTDKAILIFKGNLSSSDDFGVQFILESCSIVSDNNVNVVYLKLDNESELEVYEHYLKDYSGMIPVKAQINNKLYLLQQTVSATSQLFLQLCEKLGKERVLYR